MIMSSFNFNSLLVVILLIFGLKNFAYIWINLTTDRFGAAVSNIGYTLLSLSGIMYLVPGFIRGLISICVFFGVFMVIIGYVLFRMESSDYI